MRDDTHFLIEKRRGNYRANALLLTAWRPLCWSNGGLGRDDGREASVCLPIACSGI